MNLFNGAYTDIVQFMDVEVHFVFYLPKPMEYIPPLPVTFQFIDVETYRGVVHQLHEAVFDETPLNGVHTLRGAFTVANHNGELLFLLKSSKAHISGYLSTFIAEP